MPTLDDAMPTLDDAMPTLDGTVKQRETASHLRRKSTAPVDSLWYDVDSLRTARSIQIGLFAHTGLCRCVQLR